ncbi:phospholipase A2 [Coniochaeta ligniaria NRRL 30616]|uniref:Phospholipase A2 n=1 Tax=Coniochaeta ligniaria NRRL 30616 TaxID=1408157 RepID=A0A1J7JPZ6_9PEZI|nr:phospholipase A2 [Coniochaeta ligniaria NRRL 30616]
MDRLATADPITELINTYNDLNSCVIEVLDEEPSPLEFMRYVARNTPFVVRGAAADWKASQKWHAAHLRDALRHISVNVAVTPAGNADSPTTREDGSIVFAKPWQEDQPFPDFLDYVMRQETDPESLAPDSEVRYAQTQDDNLRNEYLSLADDVPRDIPFARIALQKDPDATNLWIGNSRSVTALHKDNYENIYAQILGRKHFVLLPPVCHPCVNERRLTPATYVRDDGGAGLELKEDDGGQAETVPFATWDPDFPERNATAYSSLAKPITVTLDPGDFLYLPAMWYHKVSQTSSDEGICVAVNYWYDMEFSGPLYCLDTLVRSVYSKIEQK